VPPPPENCGDGVINGAEECDDGANNGDTLACKSDCTAQACGDGFQGPAEACDDGNDVEDDACTNACVPTSCGDMIVQDPETCDDGNPENTDACLDTCALASCGDTFLQAGVEDCDDGNQDATDECTAECKLAVCGDAAVQAGVEDCDDGNDVNTDACVADCKAAACGDTFVQEGVEACDDGNMINTDACVTGCKAATCGDTFVQAGVEECDDGNKVAGDGCDASCKAEFCFKLTNTNAEDLSGIGWFDACVNAPGNNVEIVVRDGANNVVYQGKGPKVGAWNFDQLTSTGPLNTQFEMGNHNRAIALDNGDILRISGKNAVNSGCGGSLGNGYVIVAYDNPYMPNYYDRIKLLVAPYNFTVSNVGPRNFGNWTPGGELSFANDANMYSCFPNFGMGPSLTPFLGSVAFRVF
jgi:cysteine-rich repeat protein